MSTLVARASSKVREPHELALAVQRGFWASQSGFGEWQGVPWY